MTVCVVLVYTQRRYIPSQTILVRSRTGTIYRTMLDWNIVRRVWRQPADLQLVVLGVLLMGTVVVVEAGEITCHGIRYTYYNKGLDAADVPKTPQQGNYSISSLYLRLIQQSSNNHSQLQPLIYTILLPFTYSIWLYTLTLPVTSQVT